MTAIDPGPRPAVVPPAPAGIEANGLNVIAESERKGRARDLFWPWFGANVSVLGLSYGSFILGFGITFLQATIVALVGIVISFALCGVVALAGRRGSAPTMLLSRAAFGVNGNRLAALISWVLLVGWETALTSLAVLATSTVFTELGLDLGPLTKIVALIVVAALTVGGGIAGFDVIMRMQKWITVITGVLTLVYVALTAGSIDLRAVAALPSGNATALIGALVFVMTGFGLGWVNAAADYSRYLPRSTRGRGVFGWTTFGGAVAPVILVILGLLLAGSSPKLSAAIGADPIGALTTLLPTWFLIPFAIVAILGLVGGSVLNIYSSGLALLSAGVRVPRFAAAGVDGVLVIAGTIYVAFFAPDFVGPFQGFLITLGVPIAAWCGVFIGDVVLRRRPYADAELLDARGRYGSVRISAVLLVVIGTAIGWGLVVSTTPGFTWQGYLLGPLGGRDGAWAYANLGVLLALVLGFVGTLVLGRAPVRRQEALPLPDAR
jgi:NCS1 family nucleobase:cation symporter-1